MSQHLFHGLKAEGFDVVCMEARQVNASLSVMRNKRDKNDACGIAQVLRTKGRRRAVVAVACKLAVLLHRISIDGTEFRQDHVEGTA